MMWIVRDVGDVSTDVSIPHLRVFYGCPGGTEPPGNHMRRHQSLRVYSKSPSSSAKMSPVRALSASFMAS